MKQTHLPKDQTRREQLTKSLTEILNNLTSSIKSNPNRQLPSQIQILKLRLKLISDCAQLSVERISNLQQIFKHYCTHIFKIGKHMTFERLQYQKVHLTLDRFCVFLKDFGLMCTKIDQIQYQIIDKQEIVRNFKRISKNCRDLSFQQFIACLQKLAIIYYDEKQIYKIKKQKFKQERQARIIEYRKKMKLKKKQQQARKLKNSSQYIHAQQNQSKQQNEDRQKQEHEQNDDLIQKMMADQKIQHPNDQIKDINNTNQPQNQFGTQSKNKTKKHQYIRNMPQYCNLTAQQKIQYFYQLISVDNVHDFRKKMSQLGLPLFKQYQPNTQSKIENQNPRTSKTNADLLNVIIQNGHKQDQRRLIQLRQKLNIKKQRDKHLYSPSLSKQQYQQRKKKRQQKQQQLLKQANGGSRLQIQTFTEKQRQKKKIELMDKQLSLDVLNNIAYDDLKNKYNLQKYINSDQTDQIFLNQYGIQIQPINSLSKKSRKQIRVKSLLRQNTATTLQRKRTSSNIVQDFKKRAYEMQVKQFHKQTQLIRFVDSMKRKQKFRNQIIGNI